MKPADTPNAKRLSREVMSDENSCDQPYSVFNIKNLLYFLKGKFLSKSFDLLLVMTEVHSDQLVPQYNKLYKTSNEISNPVTEWVKAPTEI